MKQSKFSINEEVRYPRIDSYGKVIEIIKNRSFRYYVQAQGQVWSVPESALKKVNKRQKSVNDSDELETQVS